MHGDAAKELTIQLPLGETASASVFLVRHEGPSPRLLRMKIWRRPAGAQFLARFHHLRTQLESWGVEDIDRPVAARLDATGCPCVLTEFRQGVPILDRVRSGRLDRERAVGLLKPIAALVGKAHARGLAHGSLVGGNLIVDAETGRARLLDFGLTPLMQPEKDPVACASADFAGLEALVHALRTLGTR